MDSDQIPGCCGVRVIFDLELDEDAAENTDLESVRDGIKEEFARIRSGYGLVLATTIPAQESAIAVLQEFGFAPLVKDVFNPNSGNFVTLWSLLINQKPESA